MMGQIVARIHRIGRPYQQAVFDTPRRTNVLGTDHTQGSTSGYNYRYNVKLIRDRLPHQTVSMD